jgi:hypothetical protein
MNEKLYICDHAGKCDGCRGCSGATPHRWTNMCYGDVCEELFDLFSDARVRCIPVEEKGEGDGG